MKDLNSHSISSSLAASASTEHQTIPENEKHTALKKLGFGYIPEVLAEQGVNY